jgi:hypothetical protein
VPLFPLLPSVQIFFAAFCFCQDQSDPFSSAQKKKNGQIGQFGRSDPAGRSYRQPKEILGAPLCGESLF